MRGYSRAAMIFRALAHPVRLQILEILKNEGEACVCHLEAHLNQRQAYISQHLAKLREAGLVADKREGLNVFYALAFDGIEALLADAKQLALEAARAEGIDLAFNEVSKAFPKRCNCPKCEEKIQLSAAST